MDEKTSISETINEIRALVQVYNPGINQFNRGF